MPNCTVIFAEASFRDSSAQFLSLRGVLTSVSCAMILSTYSSTQNRRQKVFNRGALHFCGGLWVCAGGLDTLKIDKISTDL